MKRRYLVGAAGFALSSTLALAAPESLLPPVFTNPAPAPVPRPAPPPSTPSPAAPSPGRTTRPVPAPSASPVIQALPEQQSGASASAQADETDDFGLPPDFPSLAELEAMDEDELDAVLGLQPKFDIPPAARRSVERVGLIARAEGGFPAASLAGQPASLVRAALQATRGPLVSRWGHILLRRALASRLDAPRGMDPVNFAAMRAALLNRMGETVAARSLVQDIDSANYNRALATVAFTAYLATGDLLGMCPVASVRGDLRDDPEWELMQAVCDAYDGQERSASRRLARALGTGEAPAIDVRLAQRFAGAAGEGRRAVNIEWDNVDELTLWRYSLARALGVDLPENLRTRADARFDASDVLIPAVPLEQRIGASNAAARRGVLSSSAIIDLYSLAWASNITSADERGTAQTLRDAYVAQNATRRMAAIDTLWQDRNDYGRLVLTAYAAARLPVNEALLDDAPTILASMLSAGLDRNALRWNSVVDEGTLPWGLLVFAQANGDGVSASSLGSYFDEDTSAGQRKSQFLLAGLAGLGRLNASVVSQGADQLGVNLDRQSPWSVRIDRAGELGNGALVALLAGVGMQGESWDKMTPRHVFHIVRALNRAGLDAEARMIAAEAVARG